MKGQVHIEMREKGRTFIEVSIGSTLAATIVLHKKKEELNTLLKKCTVKDKTIKWLEYINNN